MAEIDVGLSAIIPLHLVAGNDSKFAFFMTKALLERGSNPNARSLDGVTPVHVAASYGHYETLKLLLLNGGDPWAKNVDGETPLDLARNGGHSFCVRLLEWWMNTASRDSPRFSTPPRAQTPSSIETKSPTNTYNARYFCSPILNSASSSPFYSPASTPKSYFSSHENLKIASSSSAGKNENLKNKDVACNTSKSKCRKCLHFDDTEQNSISEKCKIDVKKFDDAFLEDDLDTFSQRLSETLSLKKEEKTRFVTVLERTISEESDEINDERLAQCRKWSNEELRRQAFNQGIDVGPLTAGTRYLYERRLAALLGSPMKNGQQKKKRFSQLQAVVDGRLNQDVCKQDEELLRYCFENPPPGKIYNWREGNQKMSFCYLLIDPTVTKNLPSRKSDMAESTQFETFIDAIFYVGKGKQSRPFQHLVEAAKTETRGKNRKIDRILDLWDRGYGVVSLHVFQNLIPAEAYTREAAMIEAIGLEQLCNEKRGDYYGVAANWALGRRRRFGAFLLKKAVQIFLCDGEKQIKREDIFKKASKP